MQTVEHAPPTHVPKSDVGAPTAAQLAVHAPNASNVSSDDMQSWKHATQSIDADHSCAQHDVLTQSKQLAKSPPGAFSRKLHCESPIGGAHLPDVQVPVQHWKSPAQLPVHAHVGLSTHVPFSHAPLQQSAGAVHASPWAVHVLAPHLPETHAPVQHCALFAHASPTGMHAPAPDAQTFDVQLPLQQSAGLLHDVPVSEQPSTQTPFEHSPEQHSSSLMQPVPLP